MTCEQPHRVPDEDPAGQDIWDYQPPGYPQAPGHPGRAGHLDMPGQEDPPGYPVPGYEDLPGYGRPPGDEDLPGYGMPGYGMPGYGVPGYGDAPAFPVMPDYPPAPGAVTANGTGQAATGPGGTGLSGTGLSGTGLSGTGLSGTGQGGGTHDGTGPDTAGPDTAGRATAPAGADTRLAMLAYLAVPFSGFLVPLGVYLAARRRSGWLREHAAQALNAAVTGILYGISLGIMGVMLALDSPQVGMSVALPAVALLWAVTLFFLARAANAANTGRRYTVPHWLCSHLFR